MILAIWSICFLSTVAVSIGVGIRQKLQLVHRLDERDKLSLVAAAGVQQAIVEIRQNKERFFDSFQDTGADHPATFKEIEIGDGRVSICYNFLDEVSGEVQLRYGLRDEARKINVNTADSEVMERLFQAVLEFDDVKAQDLAASIKDWRDEDSELSAPIGSAEDPFYRNLSVHPYEAKDAPLQVLEELLLVKGMDADSMQKLRDYLTIYGDGKININTAPKAVLSAVGMSRYLVDKVLSFRVGEDGALGTDDDNIFKTPGIVSDLSQFTNLSESEVVDLTRIADQFLTVQSQEYMINAVAHLNNRRNTVEIIAVVNRNGKILYWHEL